MPANVDFVHELEKEDSIPEAAIGTKNLEVIKALSDISKHPWSADFIKSKGEGVVVLLHGKYFFNL